MGCQRVVLHSGTIWSAGSRCFASECFAGGAGDRPKRSAARPNPAERTLATLSRPIRGSFRARVGVSDIPSPGYPLRPCSPLDWLPKPLSALGGGAPRADAGARCAARASSAGGASSAAGARLPPRRGLGRAGPGGAQASGSELAGSQSPALGMWLGDRASPSMQATQASEPKKSWHVAHLVFVLLDGLLGSHASFSGPLVHDSCVLWEHGVSNANQAPGQRRQWLLGQQRDMVGGTSRAWSRPPYRRCGGSLAPVLRHAKSEHMILKPATAPLRRSRARARLLPQALTLEVCVGELLPTSLGRRPLPLRNSCRLEEDRGGACVRRRVRV